MGFFKPQKLDWDDVEGGLGERVAEEISNFVEEYCCEPKDYWNDETLANDLSVFEEQWQRVPGPSIGQSRNGGGRFLQENPRVSSLGVMNSQPEEVRNQMLW